MSKRKLSLLTATLFFTLLLASAALAAATQSVDWSVISGGGGHAESGDGIYTLDATLGQPVVGMASDAAGIELCAGFWCGGAAETARHIYLPVIQR